MNVPTEQIAYKKKIGHIGDSPVWEVGLKGGYHMVVKSANGKVETLGVGPHRAVARYIAQKRESKLVITELNKGDWVDPSHYAHLIEPAEELTNRMRAAQGL